MNEGDQLKYGWIRGGKTSIGVTDAGSQVITAASGKFVYMNAGAATLCDDGTATIWGSLESQAQTTPAAGEELNCIIDLTAIFRIPVTGGTYAVGMIGDLCDLEITGSDIQGAQLDASAEDLVVVVGGDLTNNNWVDVMMNQDVHGTGIGVDA